MLKLILELLRQPAWSDLEPAEIAHVERIYARHPEVGGILRIWGSNSATVCWAWDLLVPQYRSWGGYPGRQRLVGLSPGQALITLPVGPETRERLLSLDRRIRQDAAASGMAAPDPSLLALGILVRRDRYWIIDAALEILAGCIYSPRRILSVPGVSIEYSELSHLGVTLRPRMVASIAAEVGLPPETALDYLLGRLPRTAWEAEVAMSRLGGLP